MATQYEVEHGVTASRPRRGRQLDMSSFQALLHELAPDTTAAATTTRETDTNTTPQRNNPHATPTPVDMAALIRLLQDQISTLGADAPTTTNRDLLSSLFDALEADITSPPREVDGVSQEFLDALDRVSKKQLAKLDGGHGGEGSCPICAEKFLDDPYPLVVQLQCHTSHRFDLECVAPWLQLKGTCPMCRTDLRKYDPRRKVGISRRIISLHAGGKKGKKQTVVEEEEDEDPDMLYG